MLQRTFYRVIWTLFVVFGVVTLTFFIARVIPADPARMAAGLHANPEQVQEVRRQLGLDQPLPVQYARYVAGLLRFDLGKSIQSRRPVMDDIKLFLPATLELVFISFIIYVFVGISAGVFCAIRPHSFGAMIAQVGSIAGAAIPIFWIGLVFQLIFGGWLGWLPVAGRLGAAEQPPPFVTGMYSIDSLLAGNWVLFKDSVAHLILPLATLVLGLLAIAIYLTEVAVRQELEKAYVQTAYSKGLSERVVILRHVLRNAMNPVLTMVALQLGWLLGGTILVEVVFSWPGIGLYAYESFRTFDYAPIQAITLIITFTFMLINLVVDLIYPALDPRIRK